MLLWYSRLSLTWGSLWHKVLVFHNWETVEFVHHFSSDWTMHHPCNSAVQSLYMAITCVHITQAQSLVSHFLRFLHIMRCLWIVWIRQVSDINCINTWNVHRKFCDRLWGEGQGYDRAYASCLSQSDQNRVMWVVCKRLVVLACILTFGNIDKV